MRGKRARAIRHEIFKISEKDLPKGNKQSPNAMTKRTLYRRMKREWVRR